jgi:hypothetical protein
VDQDDAVCHVVPTSNLGEEGNPVGAPSRGSIKVRAMYHHQRPGLLDKEMSVFSWMFNDRDEAKRLFAEFYESVHEKSYRELRDRFLDHEWSEDITSPSRKSYQADVLAYWDDKPDGALRVFVVLTPHSRWRLFGGISHDFIRQPD